MVLGEGGGVAAALMVGVMYLVHRGVGLCRADLTFHRTLPWCLEQIEVFLIKA